MCFEGVKNFYPDISDSQMLGIQIPTVIYNQSYLKLVNLCYSAQLDITALIAPLASSGLPNGQSSHAL